MVRAGLSCNFADNGVVVSRQGIRLARGPMVGQLFALDIEFLRPPSSEIPRSPGDVACFTQVPVTLDLWHHRLGHVSMESTCQLVKSATGVQSLSGDTFSRCEPCILGKHSRHPNPSSSRPRTMTLLELIHCDVCGPFPVELPHGKRYFVIFLDNCSSALNLQLLASKDQAFEAWGLLQAKWERKLGLKVQRFRCDRGGELAGGSHRFAVQLEAQGIERDVTPPYEHWKNGRIERVMRTLQGRIISMLVAAQLPLTYWGEAALTAAYLFNLTVTFTLPSSITPFEMFHGHQPDVSHLRVWGVRCFAHVPIELRGKLGEKSRNAYAILLPNEGTMFTMYRLIIFSRPAASSSTNKFPIELVMRLLLRLTIPLFSQVTMHLQTVHIPLPHLLAFTPLLRSLLGHSKPQLCDPLDPSGPES